MYVDDSKDLKCLQCGRYATVRTSQERASLREEVEHGRKVRLPYSAA